MSENLFDLTGEVAVVIGATGVLGGALAEGLAARRRGGRGPRPQPGTRRGVREAHHRRRRQGRSSSPPTRPTPTSLAAAHREVEAKLGAPDRARQRRRRQRPEGHRHGRQRRSRRSRTDDWRANFDLNLVGGALLPCQEFGPAMVRRGKGSIINIASVSAHLPLSRVVAYSVGQGGGAEPHAVPRPRVGDEGRARELDHARLLPRRAEPRPALQPRRHADAAGAVDPRPHADGPLRRVAGADRRGRLPRQPAGPAASSPAPTSAWTAGSCRRRSEACYAGNGFTAESQCSARDGDP